MHAGRLLVVVREARDLKLPPQTHMVYVKAQLRLAAGAYKLFTKCSPAGPSGEARWEEAVTFEVGPDAAEVPPCTVQLMVYKEVEEGGEDELIGMGSLGLEGIEDEGNGREVQLPLVDGVGKHCGQLNATLRFFPSRTPGEVQLQHTCRWDVACCHLQTVAKACQVKTAFRPIFMHAGKDRDSLGRELIDPVLLAKGSKQAAREINERSPHSSPRRSSADRRVTSAERQRRTAEQQQHAGGTQSDNGTKAAAGEGAFGPAEALASS